MKTGKEAFSHNLSELLESRGYSQRELAALLEVSPTAVNDWVKGKKMPRFDKIEKIANYFFVSTATLVRPVLERADEIYIEEDHSDIYENFRNLLNGLNDEGVEKIMEYAEMLKATGKYNLF